MRASSARWPAVQRRLVHSSRSWRPITPSNVPPCMAPRREPAGLRVLEAADRHAQSRTSHRVPRLVRRQPCERSHLASLGEGRGDADRRQPHFLDYNRSTKRHFDRTGVGRSRRGGQPTANATAEADIVAIVPSRGQTGPCTRTSARAQGRATRRTPRSANREREPERGRSGSCSPCRGP